ncbi:enterococcin EntV, partial [Enterococcus faecium]
LGIFISAGTSVYASDQLEDSEVEAVAKGLEEMYANGVTEDNFKNYVKNNFAQQEISSVEEELNVNISDASTVVQARFNWNALGSCVANKI